MTISSIVSAVAALAFVVGAIILVGRAARSAESFRRAGRSSGHLTVVESLSLDTRRRLLLVCCDGRNVLLLTGQNDQVVGWLPEQVG